MTAPSRLDDAEIIFNDIDALSVIQHGNAVKIVIERINPGAFRVSSLVDELHAEGRNIPEAAAAFRSILRASHRTEADDTLRSAEAQRTALDGNYKAKRDAIQKLEDDAKRRKRLLAEYDAQRGKG